MDFVREGPEWKIDHLHSDYAVSHSRNIKSTSLPDFGNKS